MMDGNVQRQGESKALPLYKKIRAQILEEIASGRWKPGSKLPSEAELCGQFGASRMTVNKALSELVQARRILRTPGVGTFVQDTDSRQPELGVMRLRSIAEEIRARKHVHTMRLVLLQAESAPQSVAYAMGIPFDTTIFHSIVIHQENGVPIQVEERYVLPEIAPMFLQQDFTSLCTFDYLHSVAAVTEAENVISAVVMEPDIREALQASEGEPCLYIRRRSWFGDKVTTMSNLMHAGSRFTISGRFPYLLMPSQGK